MKNILLASAFILLSASTAGADPHFSNATAGDYKLEAIMPNGAKETTTLSSGSNALTTAQFTLGVGVKEVKVAILDDTGAAVWRGPVKANSDYVILPAPKGVNVVFAGFYSGKSTPHGTVVMNATGEPITVDLEGRNGLAASRGIAAGPAFDVKHMVRFDARESTYKATAKRKEGTPIEVESSPIEPGTYCLVWKTTTGVYRANTIGYITP